MLDEALREFRRVAELRPADAQRAVLSSASSPCGRRAGRRRPTPSGRRSRRAGPRPRRAAQPGPRARAAGPARRGRGRLRRRGGPGPRRRPRSCWAGASWRCKRGEYQVAQGRLARARELLGEQAARPRSGTGPPRWRSAGQRRRRGALERAPRPGSRPIPSSAVLQNNLAVLLELRGRRRRAPRRCCARRWPRTPSLPQISKNLADILYRNGRYDEACEAYERAAKLAPELGDDLYFKLGNIAYKRRDHERGPRELEPRDRAQSRARARPGQPRDAGA